MIYTKKSLRDYAPKRLNSVAFDTKRSPKLTYDSTDGAAANPASNTGLNSPPAFTVALDWLDITFRNVPTLPDVEQILSEVEALLTDEIDFSPTRATFQSREWHGSGRGLRGTQVLYDCGLDADGELVKPPALKIIMNGSVISQADQHAIALWLNGRAEVNDLDSTRVDVALDDHEKFIELGKITEALKKGNFFNASETDYQESGKRGKNKGITLYFGSPKSDKRLCIYDKTIQSLGKMLGNRWEARFRRGAARAALYEWIEANLHSEETTARWCKNVVVGLIDFRDRSIDDANRNRCEVLDWFSSFCDELRANPARIRVGIQPATVQKSIDWVIKAVAPSLALIRSIITTDFQQFLQESIQAGGDRLSAVKRNLIKNTNKQELCY